MADNKSTIETLISVVPAPDLGQDIFTNENLPWTPGEGIRGIFGGFPIAQAVRAAQATTPPSFDVHSLQSVFVRPGRQKPRIVYRVERVADGRTFATRTVRAEQGGQCIYVAIIGLQKRGSIGASNNGSNGSNGGASISNSGALRHAIPMPDLGPNAPGPGEIPASSKYDLLTAIGYIQKPWASHREAPPLDPFDWRHLPYALPTTTGPPSPAIDRPTEFRLRSYVRAPPLPASAGADVHLAALAFLTDEWLIATVCLASPGAVGPRSRNVAVQASISHSVLFHDAAAARADEWMLCERSTSWAADGRILVEQRLWGRDSGRLLLSCWQEGLVRLKKAAPAANL